MATFYVLPSREVFGQRFGELLTSLFPGTHYAHWDWPDLAESVAGLVEGQGDAHLIYREDLDDNIDVKGALRRDFGAQETDEVVVLSIDDVPVSLAV